MRWSDTADPRTVIALRSVFGQDREDARTVLTFLAEHTGFYQVSLSGQGVEDLNHSAGLRAAFAPIFESLSLSDAQLAALVEKTAEGQDTGG